MYKKLLFSICIFLTCINFVHPANRYVRATGGNWTAAGTWELTAGGGESVAVPTSSDDVFFPNAATLTIDGTANCKSFNATGCTGTLSMGTVRLTLNNGPLIFVSGMTFTTSATSEIAFQFTETITTGGKLIPNLLMFNSGVLTLGDDLNFNANKTIACAITGSINMNGKQINGNSSINRVLLKSNTIGSTWQLTNATTNLSNVDFRDTVFSSASNLDLSGITGGSGDCGGNSITGGGTVLTFTTPVDQHWQNADGGNWSTAANWTSRVPLPQDNVFMDKAFNASKTVTADMPRLGKTIDWTGATGTPTFTLSGQCTIYGGLNLISGMTYTQNVGAFTFEGRGNFNLDTSGKNITGNTFNHNISMFGGKITLLNNFIHGSSLFVNNGEIDCNGYNLTGWSFAASGSNLRTVKLGSGTHTFVASSGDPFSTNVATNLTFNPGTSTIVLSGTGNNTKNFKGGGVTFNNLSITGGGTGAIIITGSNTFNNITVNAPKTVNFTAGTTQTVSSFTAVGTAANPITLQSTSAGSPATLSDSSGVNRVYYCSIKDITATGGAKWVSPLALGNTDVSGNTGWTWYLALGLFWIND